MKYILTILLIVSPIVTLGIISPHGFNGLFFWCCALVLGLAFLGVRLRKKLFSSMASFALGSVWGLIIAHVSHTSIFNWQWWAALVPFVLVFTLYSDFAKSSGLFEKKQVPIS